MGNSERAPDVSVIIAAYNVQNYIERAVRSALDQQDVQVEVIVIDDASTDNTVGVVESIKDPRVILLRSTENSGPSVTRNKGIEASKAPWIAILDGDDTFAPDRLKKCLGSARSSSADIVIDNIEVRREDNGKPYPMFRPKDFGSKNTLDLATFIGGNLLFSGKVSLGYAKPFFSSAFLKKNNLQYVSTIRIGEDYMLLAEALACGARCTVDLSSCGYHYTVRTGSISHRLTLTDIEGMADGDERFLETHTISASAQRALRRRSSSLAEAKAFTKLVTAIKQKDAAGALAVLVKRPTAALHLSQPLAARIRRLFK